jgi:uncharacterized membrane protein YraQ (UPF0718 family)
MFSSPSLNPAALVLTSLLFPQDMAWARVGMAVFAVFLLPVIIERMARGEVYPKTGAGSSCPSEGFVPQNPIQVIGRWAASSGTVAVKTLPLVVLGGLASELLLRSFQHPLAPGPTGVTIMLVALFATLVALPTFFEIPFAMLLLANGFPSGAVVALLFAGPAINTPSLFTLARVSSRKVAFLAFLGVWLTAALGGLLLESWRM